MKKGDKVRFLSEIGGGIVSGFQGKNIVLVEDEDGFEIPMAINDVVVIGEEDYSTAHVVSAKASSERKEVSDGKSIKAKIHEGQELIEESQDDDDEIDYSKVTFRKPVEERKGGNQLSAYLAFVPIDIKEVTQTRFECFFVNDSNYFMNYSYLMAEGNSWTLRSHGEVEPNTKEFIEEFGREDLNELGHIAIQIIAYKKDKPFILKPAVNVEFRVDAVKFYKLHTFEENDFFEQPALLYTIIENDKVPRPLVIDAKQLKAEMYSNGKDDADNKQKKTVAKPILKRVGDDDVVVVDLHADSLLDTTAGMSPVDILNYQMEKFRKTLADYAGKKGQRIVFIHGKGEGVLRRALINDLNYRFKQYSYQDASFREYGYGATQVTIK